MDEEQLEGSHVLSKVFDKMFNLCSKTTSFLYIERKIQMVCS